MTINLKQGQESLSGFTSDKLHVNFYYNKSFSASSGQQSKDLFSSGSYSRRLRPDYSIVIFPEKMNEKEAEERGLTVWLHFDAKYRAEVYSEFFGNEKNEETDEELNEEKSESAYSVYKRGDLYKMHTYNEAIRRTAGSYVLYPGTTEKEALFEKYHEILPGVGAFPVKPSNNSYFKAEGASAVKEFIEDVIKNHINTCTDYYRINYWTNDTIVRETHAPFIHKNTRPDSDITVAVIPLRSDELLKKCRELGYFYFHSQYSGGKVSEENRKLLNADFILLINMENGSDYKVLFKVISIDSVVRSTLQNELKSTFFKGTAAIYFRCFIEKQEILFNNNYKFDHKTPFLMSYKNLMK